MLVEVSRSILVFLHLVFFASAFSLVLWSDFSILSTGVEKIKFQKIANNIVVLLLMLWVTGLAIIYLDTQFALHAIVQKPKLVLKLACVTLLTANGAFLHIACFKELVKDGYLDQKKAKTISIGGALSTGNWVLAAYIGSASMLNQFPIPLLLLTYSAVMVFSVVTGILISPLLQSRINGLRRRGKNTKPAISPQLNSTGINVRRRHKYIPARKKQA